MKNELLPMQVARAAASPTSPVAENNDPSRHSSQRMAMDDAWTLISDVLAGVHAIKQKSTLYLPRYDGEELTEYSRRKMSAPWRPEFADALRSLKSKPFAEDVGFKGAPSERIKAIAEDVDGRGNNLTQISAEIFEKAIAKGIHALLVDFPSMNDAEGEPVKVRTVADEQAAKVRPYWVQVEADDILALYTEWEGGKEIVSHFRFRETVTERDGFGEKVYHRVRVYEPGLWQVWQQRDDKRGWELISEGKIARGSKGARSVPVVLLFTGTRLGELRVKPPLLELADMQVELYRAMSRKDEVMTFASSPMLKAVGIPSTTNIIVGPRRILFTGEFGEGANRDFDYIQPAAANLAEIRNDVRSIIEDMRRLGMQPATRQTGSPTATGESIEAAKAHSAVEAWALALKDVLEQAFVFTSEWLNEDTKVECTVNTDFDVIPFAQAPLGALKDARQNGDLSQRTYWDGLKRFDILPQDFDPDAEELALAEEQEGLEGETDIDPATGEELKPVEDLSVDPLERLKPEDFTDADLRNLFGDAVADAAGLD